MKQGFSLIETILAGFILTFGVVAVLGLLASSLKISFNARNHDIAVLLAQEGVELVRNIRDNDWANGSVTFNNNFPTVSRTNCRIDKNSSSIGDSDCTGGFSNNRLYPDGNNFYVHGSGTATRFSRKIDISYFTNAGAGVSRDFADVMRVSSVVAWGGSFPGSAADYNNCNASEASRCAFTQVTLSKWGE